MPKMIALDTYRGSGRPTGFSRVIESEFDAKDTEITFSMRDGETRDDAHMRIFTDETIVDDHGFIWWKN